MFCGYPLGPTCLRTSLSSQLDTSAEIACGILWEGKSRAGVALLCAEGGLGGLVVATEVIS